MEIMYPFIYGIKPGLSNPDINIIVYKILVTLYTKVDFFLLIETSEAFIPYTVTMMLATSR